MFSNDLIRSMVTTSDEKRLRLSEQDWHIVLEANQAFAQSDQLWRGDRSWGRYLLSRLGGAAQGLDFRDSVELCCGNGFLYFSFKDLFPFDESSHFIDLSGTQVAEFERRCELSGVKRPTIICGDIGRLPMRDGSLGMVYGNSFLHHLPDVQAYLVEANRVLRRGGRFVAFHEPTATAPFWESFPRSLFKKIDDGSLTDIWLIQPEVIELLLKEAGFSQVEVFPVGLAASCTVTPWQLLLDKAGLPYQFSSLPDILRALHRLEGAVPGALMKRIAPSIAAVAWK